MLNSSIASILLLSISSCVFKKCYVYGNNKLDKYNFISQHDDGGSVKIDTEYVKGISTSKKLNTFSIIIYSLEGIVYFCI